MYVETRNGAEIKDLRLLSKAVSADNPPRIILPRGDINADNIPATATAYK